MKIEIKDIKKSFGENIVLQGVTMNIESGSIHGLMGENGAGKSTLMNIVTGILKSDEGLIIIDGKKTTQKELKERSDISFLHQEISVFEHLTVLDNLFLKQEETKFKFFIKKAGMKIKAEEILKQLNLKIDLNRYVSTCSIAEKQLIAIARSMLSGAKIIILDEPTAALSATEAEKLLKIIENQKKLGIGFVYISHRLEEMKQICSDITIIRDGKSIWTKPMSKTKVDDIIKAMVGRDIKQLYPVKNKDIKEKILKIENLSLHNNFENINFEVNNGEILGIYGLVGAGRTELLETIFGIKKQNSGMITLNGEPFLSKHPKTSIDNGVVMVSEDRKKTGLLLNQSISDNIILPNLNLISKNMVLNKSNVKNHVERLAKKLNVKSLSTKETCGSLSGGNQQKVVLAKWLGLAPMVMMLDEPTRGVDIGSKEEIYSIIKEMSKANVAIIMVSSDLPEIIGLSHRVLIMHQGEQLKILDNKKIKLTQEKIMNVITRSGEKNGKRT